MQHIDSNVHQSHRLRMKERWMKNGIETLADHEVLEVLLYYAIPRVDVNPIAHRLLHAFGSLHAVLEASAEELQTIHGIGENAAIFLSMFSDLFRRYRMDCEQHKKIQFSSVQQIYAFLSPYFYGLNLEAVRMICMDYRGILISSHEITKGTTGMVALHPRQVIEIALQKNAAGVILAHNHPKGYAHPSKEDVVLTRKIHQGLEIVGIKLVDHMIIGEEGFFSMTQQGVL